MGRLLRLPITHVAGNIFDNPEFIKHINYGSIGDKQMRPKREIHEKRNGEYSYQIRILEIQTNKSVYETLTDTY